MKHTEPEVPMELVGVSLPQGNPDHMARCLIEEYMLLGWDERQLLKLFTQPNFQATYRIFQTKGEEYVRSLIRRVCDEWRQGCVRGGKSNA
jgi:hypothetical protein